MRRRLIALLATAVSAVLLLPASAVGKEFWFVGGDEPFSAEPLVVLSMMGPDFKHPRRVTDFVISGVEMDGGPTGVAPLTPDPFSLPISLNRLGAKTKRTQDEHKDLYFSWYYAATSSLFPGVIFYDYKLVGGQHRKHPNIWRGKIRLRFSESGLDYGYSLMVGADEDDFLHWEAKLAKVCPTTCEDPFLPRRG